MIGTHHGRPPRHPPQGREYVLGGLLAALVAGLVLATQGYWRRGMILIGGALLAGAALRLFLPVRRVGLLAVRSRAFDVLMLIALGLGVILATALVPVPGR
jgi:hypothetical protein